MTLKFFILLLQNFVKGQTLDVAQKNSTEDRGIKCLQEEADTLCDFVMGVSTAVLFV